MPFSCTRSETRHDIYENNQRLSTCHLENCELSQHEKDQLKQIKSIFLLTLILLFNQNHINKSNFCMRQFN
jgi:hypothetical protein